MAKRNLKDFLSDDTLDLSLNDLTDVPVKEIAQLPKATSLDLSNNKLSMLGKNFSLSLTHLVKLDLARNELRELPSNFGLLINLKHLDLYKNRLTSLPLSFGGLKSLRWLDLKENPLDSHWRSIAGPCLNAEDCRTAARSVVSLASIMSAEIQTELERAQSRKKVQDELDEAHEKDLAKKKEKQREKKLKKKAAAAGAGKAGGGGGGENGLSTAVPLVEETETGGGGGGSLQAGALSPPLSSPSSRLSSLSVGGLLVGLAKTLLYLTLVGLMGLVVLKQTQEASYRRVIRLLEPAIQVIQRTFSFTSTTHLHKDITTISSKLIYNCNVFISSAWSSFSHLIRALYVFVTADPRFEEYCNNLIGGILFLYVKLCNIIYSTCNNIYLLLSR